MRDDGWNADYPDAENFMQLLYGPNVGQENHARFNLPEFNKLYDEARTLPDSPERTRLFDRMTELVVAYAPWRLRLSTTSRTTLAAAVGSQLQAASDAHRRLGCTSTSTRRSARNGCSVDALRPAPRRSRAAT